MIPDSPHARLFDDALVCEELRPAAFIPGAPDPAVMRAALGAAEGLLRALAVVEDHRGDDNDEPSEKAHALQRVEAKLDLLMALIAGLNAVRERQDPLRLLWWSATGACLDGQHEATPGTPGLLCLQPADWLPQPMRLPVTVVAAEPYAGAWRLWLRFAPLPESLQTALERHVFRVHRRAIAELRRKP
ncbi:PilZ domain-containing protein [Aerolutibacter ruishenii]|uniref:PilZ domain-containing protein n=1 Tax=Aerolutibacter ruishenii TaxID=686800 RepID=A0A562LN48_9GAMM|nr:PilZ domain-containing protein [Lysobacter ruishenii]TWI09023.1 PilZ domain-containing protein [Lysobacter ruishenii]